MFKCHELPEFSGKELQILIPTLTYTAHLLPVLSPVLTLACKRDAQISSLHKGWLFDGLRPGFGETLEPELLHHLEIITLEETQETASPKCS